VDLKPLFDQYLRDIRIPVFEYAIIDSHLKFRWANVINGFNMPLHIYLNGSKQIIYPTTQWSSLETGDEGSKIEIEKNFYVIPYEVNK
jgi:hypothetical protein